jgi:hypothetical protein
MGATATLLATAWEQAEPIGALNPTLPLRRAIETCLAKEPDKGYVSTPHPARELATRAAGPEDPAPPCQQHSHAMHRICWAGKEKMQPRAATNGIEC